MVLSSKYAVAELLHQKLDKPLFFSSSHYLHVNPKNPGDYLRFSPKNLKKETGDKELLVERGLITGILRIAKAELFSDLNNVNEYSLLDEEFATCYGFTQSEVDKLLTKGATES